MPAPNDLTPEEEAAFGAHGVPSSGPGSEPIVEGAGDIHQQPAQEEYEPPVQQEQQPAAQPEPPSRHRTDGTFKSAEEFQTEMEAFEAANPSTQQPAQQQPAQQQTVPLAALHEARQRAANVARENALLTARMNALLTSRAPEQQQEALPDINDDPAGYVMGLERRLAVFEQSQIESRQQQQIDNALNEDEARFSQMVPDYEQASDYFVQSRATELLQFHTPQEAQRIMTEEARQIAQQAWQRGMPAAQMIYNMAAARGYRVGNTAANPVTSPIPPQQQQRRGPTPVAAVAAVAAAQQQSRSLSGGVGNTPAGALNANALLQMTDEEFEAYLKLGSKGANERFAQVG